ncbi:hypothetical protein LCGC14_2163350 [marine sediment metagenome]|uniref:Uncharacterized protein n=1 Tax=marine sediment metagenome TaxID=412755 RepID=A0A0F9G4T7_9ZZZZ
MHWLFYYGIAFGIVWLAFGIYGTIQERRRRKENRLRPTHRRTYPKV